MVSKEPVALANVAAQQRLFEDLEAARIANSRSIEAVARLLGIEVPYARSLLRGEQDITFTELQLLAYAVGALVEYGVESLVEEAP